MTRSLNYLFLSNIRMLKKAVRGFFQPRGWKKRWLAGLACAEAWSLQAAARRCVVHGALRKIFRRPAIAVLAVVLSACAVNPVTGKRELHLVSESQELAIGAKQYLPSRQEQGGDYNAEPEVVAYVRKVGARLAAVADRRLPYEFVVLNNDTPNAWALPGGKIAVNRGLLTELRSEAELAAVLAHEIVHAAAGHGAQQLQRGMLMQGAVLAASAAASSSRYGGLAGTAASLGSALLGRAYGRDAEREADYYGMRYMLRAGYDPYAAVRLQELFVKLSKQRSPGWLGGLFASHPPSRERLVDNRRHADESTRDLKGKRLLVGERVYRRHLAPLLRAKPAYAAYRKGRKALKKGHPREALRRADEAIAIEPREALFHALRGDALRKLGRPRAALRATERALALNPDYFAFHIDRGLALRELGEQSAAAREFERSIELLPTATAYYALGLLASQQGDRARAVKYLRVASRARSEIGQRAQADLLKLDLNRHPRRYVRADLRLDRDGYLLIVLRNRATAALRDLVVVVGRQRGGRLEPLERIPYHRTLKAGARATISTDIGPLSPREARALQARVERAGVASASRGR